MSTAKRQNIALQNSLTRALFIMFPFTCFEIFNWPVFWPLLGQAHHMFSRFPKLWLNWRATYTKSPSHRPVHKDKWVQLKGKTLHYKILLTRAVFIMFPFTCFDIFNVEVFWPFLGQALHMFSRFPNLQIYNIFHEIFFVLFFTR